MKLEFEDRTTGGFWVRNIKSRDLGGIYVISAQIGNHSSEPPSEDPKDWRQETYTATGRHLTWTESNFDLVKLTPKTDEPVVARRSLVARCPMCNKANIVCLAPAELNQVETESLEPILSASEMTQLYTAPAVVKCTGCKAEFKIVVSDEYYYEER
jgi:hypothetical protein